MAPRSIIQCPKVSSAQLVTFAKSQLPAMPEDVTGPITGSHGARSAAVQLLQSGHWRHRAAWTDRPRSAVRTNFHSGYERNLC